MNDNRQSNDRITVLIVGPATDQLGGMATVVSQTLDLDYGERFITRFLANTRSEDRNESTWDRIRRHIHHARTLRTTIRQTRAQLVHIHTCSGFSFYRSVLDMLLAQTLRCPAILHIHGAAFDEFYQGSSSTGRLMIRWSLARAKRVIALSQRWKRILTEISPKARVNVVENAVETPTSPADTRNDKSCRFVLLAKMDTWKGIDDLLDACSLVPFPHRNTIEMTLAGPPGTAGDEKTIRRKIADRKLQQTVHYVGAVRGSEKATLLRQADVYIQPSHNEGMPISVLEAFSYGLPVVATTVGAMPEIIDATETGTLVAPHDPQALASAIVAMAGDFNSRRTYGKNARALAQSRFGLARLRKDIVGIYDQILATAPK